MFRLKSWAIVNKYGPISRRDVPLVEVIGIDSACWLGLYYQILLLSNLIE